MNPISFFEEQVKIWNENKKCGFCWQFSAPLKESAMNIQQIRESDDCCVQLMLTDLRLTEQKSYGSNGLITANDCVYSFNLYALLPSRIDINTYNEIDGHTIEESKWKTHLEPLLDCLGCDTLLDICTIWKYPIQIPTWGAADVLINYQDANYDGWRIPITFRIRK